MWVIYHPPAEDKAAYGSARAPVQLPQRASCDDSHKGELHEPWDLSSLLRRKVSGIFPSVSRKLLAVAMTDPAPEISPKAAAAFPPPLEGGELVWCKMRHFPWWPALTFESVEVSESRIGIYLW